MLEIIWCSVEDRPGSKCARVEYRADERSQVLLGLVEGNVDLGRIGHVAGHRDQVIWSVRGHGSQPISAARQHCDSMPLAGEPRGHGDSQTRPNARNDYTAMSTHFVILARPATFAEGRAKSPERDRTTSYV
jgi:hypothetical protein